MRYLTIIVCMLLAITNVFADECLVNRAAFDIGSGTTKMVVASVDTCHQTVIQILEEAELPVGYKEDLGTSQGIFSEEIQNKGLKTLRHLKHIAKKYDPEQFVGVATSAFRTSNNGEMFTERIEKDLGIRVKIISQRTEAILGFLAAYPQTDLEKKECLVWDIGGGSMQMVMVGNNDTFEVYEGKLASVSIKNMIITALWGRPYNKINSPNPLGKATAARAVNLAQYYADIHVSNDIKSNAQNLSVLGIGGVHYYSVRKQCVKDGKTYTISDVERTLALRQALTDEELGGKYAPTDVSNLTLVLGFMKALNIKEIRTLKANMAHGVLIYPKYWE